jgi:hypothetical protein
MLMALSLVLFHGPEDQLIGVNPEQVIALREPRGNFEKHFHETVKCLIFTSDGKFQGVTETCQEAARILQRPPDEEGEPQ